MESHHGEPARAGYGHEAHGCPAGPAQDGGGESQSQVPAAHSGAPAPGHGDRQGGHGSVLRLLRPEAANAEANEHGTRRAPLWFC